MSFFINDAFAEASSASMGSQEIVSQLMVFGGVFLVFWLLFIRPQNKKIKEHKEMTENLGKNDEVVTNGGILGKIVSLHDGFVVIEVANESLLTIQRQSISSVMPKGTIKAIKN